MMIIKSNPKEIIVDYYGIYCLCSTVVRCYKMF